jgi:hypothetical protein
MLQSITNQHAFLFRQVDLGINQKNTFTFSTFGDFTKQEGFLFGGSGFGANPDSFQGTIETGGPQLHRTREHVHGNNMTAEFAFGLHFQRANTIPLSSQLTVPLIADNFAITDASGAVLTPVNTTCAVELSVELHRVRGWSWRHIAAQLHP